MKIKRYLVIGLAFMLKSAIAQDTLSLSVEINNQPIYLNADMTNEQTYISSNNKTNWIIEKHTNYVEIRTINNHYLYIDKVNNEIKVSENQKARWKITDMGGWQFFLQPFDDKNLYLSVFGSEVKLLQYNPDLMLSIHQKWFFNGW